MFKIKKIFILIIAIFLLSPLAIKGSGAVRSAPNSKIYLISQNEEDDIIENSNYNWTFTSAEIDANKTSAPNALAPYRYHYNRSGKDICLYPDDSGKSFDCRYYSFDDSSISATFILDNSNSTKPFVFNDHYNIDNIYVYYPYVGTYNGKSVGLKISLIDYKSFNKLNTNVELPTITFFKSKPTIAMYGLNSVDLRYEFYDSECYNNSLTFDGCEFDTVNGENIKGYGTLIDIDALQSVKLSDGIDRAYIYSNYDYVCGEFDYQEGAYAHNALSTCKKELANSVYKDNQYAYLIPNYLPREVIGGSSSYSSDPCNGIEERLKSGVLIFDKYYSSNIPEYEIRTCFEKNEGTLNTITSAPIVAVDANKYAWANILYNGSFELTYYFSGEYTSLGSTNGKDIDKIEIKDPEKVSGGGGEFTFTPNTIIPIYKLTDLKYRVINQEFPFLDLRGNLRNTGRNWCGIGSCDSNNSTVQKYITKRPNSNGIINIDGVEKKTGPLYSFTLTPDNIRRIRAYNKDKSYDEFDEDFINSLLTSNDYATFISDNSLCQQADCDINKIIDNIIEESE